MDLEKKYQQASGYVSRVIADELLLIPIGSKTQEFNGLIHLNETSQYLWDQLEEPKSFDELCDLLSKEFNVTDSDIRNDILEFLQSALKNKLLREIN